MQEAKVIETKKTSKENVMKRIKIDKVTLNFGAGSNQGHLEKGLKLIKLVGGKDPVKTLSKSRIPTWSLRPGLPIGCKLTLRGKGAEELLKRLFHAADNKILRKSFDEQGNFSFGVKEYINIPGVKYDPEIGILGFDVAVTLTRPGYRIMRRNKFTKSISKDHRISKDEARLFVKEKLGIEIQDQ